MKKCKSELLRRLVCVALSGLILGQAVALDLGEYQILILLLLYTSVEKFIWRKNFQLIN